MSPEYLPPASLFRANDIRGIALGDHADLTPEFAYYLGRALGTLLRRRKTPKIWLCRDARLSSPALHNKLAAALTSSGMEVLDLGIGPTPLLCHAVATASFPGEANNAGIMITASHNPLNHNGFKIIVDGKPFFGEALTGLRDLMLAEDYLDGDGTHIEVDHQASYLSDFQSRVQLGSQPLNSESNPMSVVLDAANGAAGPLAVEALEVVGVEVIPLFCDMDGHFPNHSPDTSDPANLSQLVDKVIETKAFCGIALDGDGDRTVAVTEEGKILNADDLMRLFSKDVLAKTPNSTIVFDVKTSNHLINYIHNQGGQPLMTKSGRSHIQAAMYETEASLAGEFSSHFFFADNWYGSDDGIYAAARLLEICQNSGKTLTELLADKEKTHATDEIYLPVPDERKFDLIKDFVANAEFDGANLVTIDGLRIEYPAGWALVRASNTSAAITLRFEAETPSELNRLISLIHSQLEKAEPTLNLEKLDVSRL